MVQEKPAQAFLVQGIYRTIELESKKKLLNCFCNLRMPQSIPQVDVIPISQAINKYFDIAIYLLVLMGFATLASTGGVDLTTILLVGSALAFRGYLLAERRRVVISERWTTPLTIAYFIF